MHKHLKHASLTTTKWHMANKRRASEPSHMAIVAREIKATTKHDLAPKRKQEILQQNAQTKIQYMRCYEAKLTNNKLR